MGKSNILEAVYVLSALKSFREHIPSHFIRWKNPEAQLDMKVRTQYGSRQLSWNYANKRRLLHIDRVRCNDLSSWFALIRSVVFCPDQISIVRAGPRARRNFLGRARFTASPAYLLLVRKYIKVLEQKKALLKTGNPSKEQLSIWNEQLVKYGVRIALQRQMIIEDLSGPFQKMHDYLSGKEHVTLQLTGVSAQKPEEIRAYFHQELTEKMDSEIRLHRCLVGPHCDNMKIHIDGVSAKKFASQGQVRSIVLALKLAELEAARIRGENPLFLLDDLSSELDRDRTNKLLELLSERENQIWITTTDPSYLGGMLFSKRTRFLVEDGKIKNV